MGGLRRYPDLDRVARAIAGESSAGEICRCRLDAIIDGGMD
jgi:hypothetical protein